MAALGEEEAALQALGDEATCPLCLDYFKQPVGLACGHNFCHDCLARLGSAASCPQCRAMVEPSSTWPNQALANMVRLVKSLRLSGERVEEESSRRLCQAHLQPLQSFCTDEKCLLCCGCLGGHQGHILLSLPEAAQLYKGSLDALLEPLEEEAEKLLERRQAEERSRLQCQEQFAAEKQKVGLVFTALLETLRETQPIWVAWLGEQERKLEAERDGTLAKLSGEAARLQELFAETERKCRRPDWEFLQDIRDTVDRCESYVVGHITSVSPKLQDRLGTILEKNGALRQRVEKYNASLKTALTTKNLEQLLAKVAAPQKPGLTKATISLDDRTAHPRLQCLRLKVAWAKNFQDLPDRPERFDREFCLLGCEGFVTGQHWWEVSVHCLQGDQMWGQVCWAIGVAKESVRRKGNLQLNPQEGIWAVGRSSQVQVVAFSAPFLKKLYLQKNLTKVRVKLDYEAGEVEFFDADTDKSIYTFCAGPFLGERILPFFYLGEATTTLFLT
ncbi:tripartite motif-containing protein 10-like [Candoia aspera]|uniref:tripartite motif-containing protein 10-like n=1 Tax=Candoia aspera TaxID=51853 RepID=UPI002FD8572C